MKKNNTWLRVVITIVVLELVVGGIIFAYKKLGPTDSNNDSISTKDKEVVSLYNKIAYNDIDTIDVMSPSVMLYYGYKNAEIKESTNCDVVNIEDDTTGYSCNGIVDYISSSDLEKSVKNIYGDVSVEKTSFELDKNHYVFYDSTMDGYVLFTKDVEEIINPVNLNLKNASKNDDEDIILTVEVLDGVIGEVLNTYNYTFEKNGNNYYLTSKEIVTS